MNRLAKLSARFIGEQGFSIGIDDVTPAQQLKAGLFSAGNCLASSLPPLSCRKMFFNLPAKSSVLLKPALKAPCHAVLHLMDTK